MTAGSISKPRATIEDLYRVQQKAELVDGEIMLMAPTGEEPGYAGDEVFVSLHDYARTKGHGRAVGDNKGFRVHLARRQSFSPDAAYYVGPRSGMQFYEGAPVFAVEVRSVGDYGPQRARWSSGTWTCWPRSSSSTSIAPPIPKSRRAIGAVRSPRPSLPCRAGACPSMHCSREWSR
jgi:hypothetical protein